eukprot:14359944-Heterocapsa_arctica.AAC.1
MPVPSGAPTTLVPALPGGTTGAAHPADEVARRLMMKRRGERHRQREDDGGNDIDNDDSKRHRPAGEVVVHPGPQPATLADVHQSPGNAASKGNFGSK